MSKLIHTLLFSLVIFFMLVGGFLFADQQFTKPVENTNVTPHNQETTIDYLDTESSVPENPSNDKISTTTVQTIEKTPAPSFDTMTPAPDTAISNQELKPPTKSATTTLSTIPIKQPEKIMRWGAYSGYSENDLLQFEEMVGKAVDMRSVFVKWNEPFSEMPTKYLKDNERVLVIFWEQYDITLDGIINGESDEYIQSFASATRAYASEIIIAPLHEMNGDWVPWGGVVGSNTPEKVVATWRHIYDTFGKVPNVKFAWTVNNISDPLIPINAIRNYYPGDAYVDYTAVDGFNFGNPWLSFSDIFDNVLKELSNYNKPIYILSMASAEGAAKPAWIHDAISVQMPKYPLLMGWIWFDEDKERDWRVNSDVTSLQAFRNAINNPPVTD